MTAVQQLRKSIIYLLPTVVSTLLPFATLPIFTRILTPADYGVIALGLVWGVFATGLANMGLPLTYERNFFQYRDQQRGAQLLYSVLACVVPLLTLGGVLTALFREDVSRFLTGSPQHGWIFVASYCTVGLQSLRLYYLTYLRNEGNAKAYVGYSLDETVLWTAFSLLFVAVLRMGPIGMPLGQLLASAGVLSLVSFRFARRLKPALDGSLLREAVLLSLPLTPRLFLNVVSNNFDKYIIGLLGSMGGVGIYSIGQKLGVMVFTFMTALQNVFAPGVYSRMFAGGTEARDVGRYLTPFAYASVAAALLVALFAEEVLILLTPREYHAAAGIVTVLAVYYAILFFGKQPQLIYAKKTALVSVLGGVGVALHVAFGILFVQTWGAVGAAWAVLVAGGLTTAAGVWLGQRHFRIHYEAGRLFAIYSLLVLAAVGTYALSLAEVIYPLRLAFKVVALGAYLDVGRRAGILTGSTLPNLRAAVRRKGAAQSTTPGLVGSRGMD
jgi:O-antigen/teichoic acid export membrane protein